jgi:hypothetical protein
VLRTPDSCVSENLYAKICMEEICKISTIGVSKSYERRNSDLEKGGEKALPNQFFIIMMIHRCQHDVFLLSFLYIKHMCKRFALLSRCSRCMLKMFDRARNGGTSYKKKAAISA